MMCLPFFLILSFVLNVIFYYQQKFLQGIATTVDKLYIADGHRIREVDLNSGVISTLAGKTSINWGEDQTGSKPVCAGWKTPSHDHQFDWPTDMALNPIDNSIYVLDGGHIVSVSHDKNIQVNCISNIERYELISSLFIS